MNVLSSIYASLTERMKIFEFIFVIFLDLFILLLLLLSPTTLRPKEMAAVIELMRMMIIHLYIYVHLLFIHLFTYVII